jgi:hypothetical protein
MGELLGFLKELLPVWLILLLLGFGYLILLFKRASDRFIDLASQQARFLSERVDVIDKSTGVFTRTIDQQEKEIQKLTQQLNNVTTDQEANRKVDNQLASDELKVLSASIERLSAGQEALFQVVSGGARSTQASSTFEQLWNQLASTLKTDIPEAIAARDRSAATAAVKSDLRNLVTAQEAYFADHVEYTSKVSNLSYGTSAGVVIENLALMPDGWNATARHEKTGIEYGIFIGTAPEFAGLQEGTPFPIRAR